MKTFKLLFILSAIALIYTQDCNNPLLESLNIDGLGDPTVPEGNLTFCPNFQNQPVCCSADTINGFQSNVQQAIDELQNLASQRDRWLASAHNEILPNFLTNFFIFNASMEALRNTSQEAFVAATQKFAYINSAAAPLRAAMTPLQNNFAAYQQARVQCFSTMIDFYASAYCLACNPNYQTLGVNSDGTIVLSDSVCTTMKESCFRFIQLSDYYSLFITLRQVSEQLYEANTFLRELDLGSSNLVSDIQNEQVPYSQDFTADEDILDPTVRPPNCTSAADCDWICTDVFNSARLNNQLLALGGLPVDSLTFEDIATRANAAPQGVRQPARFLQDGEDVITPNIEDGITSVPGEGEDVAEAPVIPSPVGTWNPPVGNSGAIIEIVENPANVVLTTVNETAIQAEAVAFAEPPNPDSLTSDNQETALSGSVLTASIGLLSLLAMFYLG